MSSTDSNPYNAPQVSAQSDLNADRLVRWTPRTLSYIAVVTGIVGAVTFQFITDEPKVTPAGVKTVNAYLEIAALTAVLSFVSAISLLLVRHRLALRMWSRASLGLLTLAILSVSPGAIAVWKYVVPFVAFLLGLK